MPRPHGVNTRIFSTRSRAIVLEAEWMVMTQRVANELKPLVKLAKEQGWTIESAQNGTKLVWRGPNGEGPVYTGYRCQGRDFANYRAELVRAGLKLDEKQAESHVAEQSMIKILDESEDMDLDEMQDLLNRTTGMLAYLHAKAVMFDRARADAKEWQEIAQQAQDAADEMSKKLSESETMLASIHACFKLSAWAILPEIARLLGIDSGGQPGLGAPMSPPTVRRS